MDADYKRDFAVWERRQEEKAFAAKMEMEEDPGNRAERLLAEQEMSEYQRANPVKTQGNLTKTATIAEYKEKLATDARWALRGLVVIFEHQTADEQIIEETNEQNGVGFTGTDGNFGSSLAKQYIARGALSPKQMKSLFKIMPKYAGQLYRVSQAKSSA